MKLPKLYVGYIGSGFRLLPQKTLKKVIFPDTCGIVTYLFYLTIIAGMNEMSKYIAGAAKTMLSNLSSIPP